MSLLLSVILEFWNFEISFVQAPKESLGFPRNFSEEKPTLGDKYSKIQLTPSNRDHELVYN